LRQVKKSAVTPRDVRRQNAVRFEALLAVRDKISALRTVVATGLFLSLLLCWRLWTAWRLFPQTPVWSGLPPLPPPLVATLFGAMLVSLLLIVFLRQKCWPVLIFLSIAGLLSLWDQMRWQPWFFEYFFLLAAVGYAAWDNSESRKRAALNAGRLVLASIYLWSGLQKLNVNFLRETWPDITGPMLHHFPHAIGRIAASCGIIVPLLEIVIGLGLITRKFRKAAALLAIGTHLFVLLMLISSRENFVVWPWNVAMVLLVAILFLGDRESTPSEILVPRTAFHALVMLLFGLLPVFSFFDLWDSYLSSALYSGNTDQSVIYVSALVLAQLPVAVRPHVWQEKEPYYLDVNRWAYAELNVPIYPEPRIYRRAAAQICAMPGNYPGEILLRIRKKPNMLTGVRQSLFYDCDHIYESNTR
jgi:uncharacterized membrane protein YphA (DoxX/SURF4 family)